MKIIVTNWLHYGKRFSFELFLLPHVDIKPYMSIFKKKIDIHIGWLIWSCRIRIILLDLE